MHGLFMVEVVFTWLLHKITLLIDNIDGKCREKVTQNAFRDILPWILHMLALQVYQSVITYQSCFNNYLP